MAHNLRKEYFTEREKRRGSRGDPGGNGVQSACSAATLHSRSGRVLLIAVVAEDAQQNKLDRQYQAAVADYEAGRYPQAADQLEKLLPYAPRSYELQELLGMVYASLSQNDKAIDHLKTAVQIKPDLAEARTNWERRLCMPAKAELAAEQFRKAVELEPQNYDANHNLGEFYVQTGKLAEAQPYLEQAYQIHPDAYDNGYDLAMADFLLASATRRARSFMRWSS